MWLRTAPPPAFSSLAQWLWLKVAGANGSCCCVRQWEEWDPGEMLLSCTSLDQDRGQASTRGFPHCSLTFIEGHKVGMSKSCQAEGWATQQTNAKRHNKKYQSWVWSWHQIRLKWPTSRTLSVCEQIRWQSCKSEKLLIEAGKPKKAVRISSLCLVKGGTWFLRPGA